MDHVDIGKLDAILAAHPRERSALIPLLQETQQCYGYLPREALMAVAEHLRQPVSAVYGVATFYAQFHLTPQGRHRIRVCQGTACHVRGGKAIMRAVADKLGVGPGETTPDCLCSLEGVACFGSCALAPVVVVDGKVYARVTPEKARRLTGELR